MSRKGFCLALAAGLLASGCSSEGSDWKEYFQIMRQSLRGSMGSQGITRDQAAAIAYASLGFRINGGREGLLVLATDNNGGQVWTASSHIVLETRGGRIVRSVGLPHDIGGTTARGSQDLPPLLNALHAPYSSSRTVDFPDIGAYDVVLNCIATPRGSQRVTIIGTVISTIRVDETCRSTTLRWSFTDNYWIAPDSGFVWHSVQHLHPAGTIVQTEIFRPPG